jgi:hypothetical protein
VAVRLGVWVGRGVKDGMEVMVAVYAGVDVGFGVSVSDGFTASELQADIRIDNTNKNTNTDPDFRVCMVFLPRV